MRGRNPLGGRRNGKGNTMGQCRMSGGSRGQGRGIGRGRCQGVKIGKSDPTWDRQGGIGGAYPQIPGGGGNR